MDADLPLRAMSALGLVAMLVLAWLLSEARRQVPWRIVLWGLGLQFVLGILVLRTGVGLGFFAAVKSGFDLLTAASEEGARFLFGNLTNTFYLERALLPGDAGLRPTEPYLINAVVAFRVLPVIIFVSGLAAVLQHLGIIQRVIQAIAWLMRRTLKTSGAETFGASLEIFLGIEAMSALGAYCKSLTRSEIFTCMATFLATIAASVMVAYAGFGAEPGHLLTASLMNAPAAILIAKLMVPERDTPLTLNRGNFDIPKDTENIFDAAARGASVGLTMALSVGALLIVFIGLIFIVDSFTEAVSGASISYLLGWLFRPFAFLLGVPWADIPEVSELFAVKSVFNEFLAYQQMQPLIEGHIISARSTMIATYALCGFANPGSLGIMIGAMAALAPERRGEIAQLSLKAFVAGTLACFSTACIAGMLGG